MGKDKEIEEVEEQIKPYIDAVNTKPIWFVNMLRKKITADFIAFDIAMDLINSEMLEIGVNLKDDELFAFRTSIYKYIVDSEDDKVYIEKIYDGIGFEINYGVIDKNGIHELDELPDIIALLM